MPPTSTTTRRRFLQVSTAGTLLWLAGCNGNENGNGDDDQRAEELRQRVDELERENRRLRGRLNESSARADRLEDELASERRRVRKLSGRLDNRTADLRRMNAELGERERRIASLRAEVARLDGEFPPTVHDQAREVGLAARGSVVQVIADGDESGTGWVFGDGQVVTNAHVVRGESSFAVETFDGDRRTASVVESVYGLDPDVALLSADTSGLAPLSTGRSDDLERGDPLVAVGHPGNVGDWIISLGPYLGHEQFGAGKNFQTDVPIQGGSSGSPVLDLEGTVVGMIHSSNPRPEPPNEYSVSKADRVYEVLPDTRIANAVEIEAVEMRVEGWTE